MHDVAHEQHEVSHDFPKNFQHFSQCLDTIYDHADKKIMRQTRCQWLVD